MPKKVAKTLTDITVRSEKPAPNKRREVYDADVPGLTLVIQSTGRKSWAFRYRFAGKSHKLTLGPLLTLEAGKVTLNSPSSAAP